MVDMNNKHFIPQTNLKFPLLLFFALLFIAAPFVHAQQAPLAGFDDYVNKALKEWEVPGVAIAVVKDDRVVLARGYGVKSLGGNQRVDERTLFGIASNSKAFTAAAIAMLVDEGKLKWDDPVIKHLPGFQLYDPYATREITIRDLLSHRSGLPAYGGDILWWGGDYSRNEIVHRVRFVKPAYSFRSRYAYQNIPFIIAGQIIEAVTGKSWDEFVAERILKPLNMSETITSITKFKQGANTVTPHIRVDGKVIPIAWRNLDNGAAAAGLNSNVVDVVQWLRFQLNEGKWNGKELIGPRQMREMHAPQTIIPFQSSTQSSLKTNFRAYGLGWDLREYMSYKVVQHGGWTDGQLSMTAMIPDLKLGVVVLTNIHNRQIANAFIHRIFDAYMNQLPTDWSAYYLKQTIDAEMREKTAAEKQEKERAKDSKPTLPLVQYAGKYANDLYGEISFAEENGKLIARLSHSPTYIGDLEHWQYNTFRIIWRDPVAEKTFVTFTINEQGKAESVKMAMADFIDPSEYEYKRN
jgi:CubicO group peptidase (beta-lactamase class C family)